MKLKLMQIQNAMPALQKVLNAELPVKVAFRLSRLAKAVGDVAKDIEQQRANLVKKYGEEVEGGRPGDYRVLDENISQFQQEFGELLQEDVRLDTEPVKLEALEGVKLTAIDMVALEPFISE